MDLTPEAVAALFTCADGTFLFARWGRPIVPVVFGLDEAVLPVMKGALEAAMTLAGHRLEELDPEPAGNLLMFFCGDWGALREVPNLGRLVDMLISAEANQYSVFRFDQAGAIRTCFLFVQMDAHMSAVPAESLTLSQAVQTIPPRSEMAFEAISARAVLVKGWTIVKPEIGSLIRAAHDPFLPSVGTDPPLALGIAARMGWRQ
jgi:hypothetical protein